jgi:hypothetical protein
MKTKKTKSVSAPVKEIKNENPEKEKGNNNALIITLAVVFLLLLIAAGAGWALFLKGKIFPEPGQKFQPQPGREQSFVPNTPPPGQPEDQMYSSQNPASPSESSAPVEGVQPPSVSQKDMGYLKKVYTQSGKNLIDIDYIQWLSGADAEKAMREDGKCPRAGECIVYDGYYIRNQNPLIRTFEVVPEADIRMQTLDAETTGLVDENKQISFEDLKNIFAPRSANQKRYQYVPFIVELSNNKIVKITEQYIP